MHIGSSLNLVRCNYKTYKSNDDYWRNHILAPINSPMVTRRLLKAWRVKWKSQIALYALESYRW